MDKKELEKKKDEILEDWMKRIAPYFVGKSKKEIYDYLCYVSFESYMIGAIIMQDIIKARKHHG